MRPELSAAAYLRLQLNALPGIGPVTARRLSEAFGGDLTRALAASRDELLAIPGIGPVAVTTLLGPKPDPLAEYQNARRLGFKILTQGDPEWPEALNHLWDPPLVLYVEGAALPVARAVAIVGTRRCTPYGAAMARNLATGLAQAGWWVVSGLAAGIDTAAHEGALEGGGPTAAVLGHGLERTHPPSAHGLRRRIAATGCILSEFPLGRVPDTRTFPQRNRLVAALCRAVVVIETDRAGGSHITARFASELGRTVCAVPGRADSPASRGCHDLIRDGATLITQVEDILEELGEAPTVARAQTQAELPELSPFNGGEAHDAESLASLTQMPVGEAAALLTRFEVEGHLRRRPDGRHERV